jgi:hypothetical protein
MACIEETADGCLLLIAVEIDSSVNDARAVVSSRIDGGGLGLLEVVDQDAPVLGELEISQRLNYVLTGE